MGTEFQACIVFRLFQGRDTNKQIHRLTDIQAETGTPPPRQRHVDLKKKLLLKKFRTTIVKELLNCLFDSRRKNDIPDFSVIEATKNNNISNK